MSDATLADLEGIVASVEDVGVATNADVSAIAVSVSLRWRLPVNAAAASIRSCSSPGASI